MCLYVKGKEIKTAEEDIVCYKVLKIDRNFLGQKCVYTPYTGLHINKRFLKGEADFHAFGPTDIKLENSYSSRYEVSGGFVHTCSDMESAKILCECLLTFTCPMVVIYKCIIPKGTEYIRHSLRINIERLLHFVHTSTFFSAHQQTEFDGF